MNCKGKSLHLAATAALLWATATHAGPMSLDGQFSVSESGAATYTIPIQVPPGTGGVEPTLALTYNSQTGNGLLGVGWSLSGLSAITRCPRTLAQDNVRGSVNFDSNDRYCLDGQRLLATSGTYGADGTEYRTEREGYSKIVSYGSAGNGPAWFKVWTKAGQVIEYGHTADSRIEAIKAPSSFATWPNTTVRLWAINKVSDTKGNYLTYSYTEDPANGDYYPSRIDYTGNTNASVTPNNSVQFEYETRADVTPIYMFGNFVKSTVRLKNLKVYSNAALSSDYRLAYQSAQVTGNSIMVSLSHCNGQGACLPSVNLTWHGGGRSFEAGWGSSQNLTTGDYLGESNRLFIFDVGGDGKSDLLIRDSGNNIALKSGDGTGFNTSFDSWQLLTTGSYLEENNRIFFADVNGDGRADLLLRDSGNNINVKLFNGTGFNTNWDASQFLTSGTYLGENNRMFFADVNGDGRADMLIRDSGNNIAVKLSNGTGFNTSWDSAQLLTTGSYLGENNRIFFADVNGDGRADLLLRDSGNNIAVKFSNGNGFNTSWDSWQLLTSGSYLGENNRLFFMDINGDGRADLVMRDSGNNIDVKLSDGVGFNASWDSWQQITTGDYLGENNRMFFADINGDGRLDLIVRDSANNLAAKLGNGTGFNTNWESSQFLTSGSYLGENNRIFFTDVDGDGRADILLRDSGNNINVRFAQRTEAPPDTLVSINNGLASVASFSYGSLTSNNLYTKDTGANASVYPKLDIQSPMYVVSSVSSSNGIGGSVTTNYKYGGLKAEIGTGRGLLGFRWMESTQAETGIITRTEYRQDWPYVGLPSIVKKSLPGAGNNGLLSQVSNSYSCLNPQSGSACTISTGNRYFPYLSQSVESSWDLNGTALPIVTTTHQFDAWGNATQVTVGTNDGYSKTTTNQYSNDATNWYLGRLTRSQVQSVTP